MRPFKIALEVLTLIGTFFFAFWEMKLRRGLTDNALEKQREFVSDYSEASYGIRKEFRRERILNSLPSKVLFRLRVVASLKFLLAAILILEVLFFTR